MTNQVMTTKSYFNTPAVQNKFNEVLGERSKQFVTSILSVTSDNKLLAKANPESVMKAAMKAATLNLAIEPSLGFAYIVPYGNNAQFQLGYKGLIQLAIRSGQIKNINSGIIYASQFISYDPLFESLKVDFSQEPSEEIAGYFATIELINGFKKLIFWGYDKVYSHGKRFSKSFNNGPWKTDFDAMAQKTLLKALISVYAPLSQEMEKAVIFDAEAEDMKAPPREVNGVFEATQEEIENFDKEAYAKAKLEELSQPKADTETGEIVGAVTEQSETTATAEQGEPAW